MRQATPFGPVSHHEAEGKAIHDVLPIGVNIMPSKDVTGKKAGSAASSVLRNPNTSAKSKTAAGSALVQRPSKRGK